MAEPERLDFLVYYRKQLQIIINKLDREIEKAGGKEQVEGKNLLEDEKDLLDQKFLEMYLTAPGLADVLGECRDYLGSISEKEQSVDGRLYYSSKMHGERFAMIAMSPRCLHLYFAPRLGLYENLPTEVSSELRFGKSLGDRWDKFKLSSPRQAKKAISYLNNYFTSCSNIEGDVKAVEGNAEG